MSEKKVSCALREALETVFGHTGFRSGLQEKAVEAVAQCAQDVFVSMPTGAGKSLCYQLPAVVTPDSSVTVVVSTLIALMSDQLKKLRDLGVNAETINITMEKFERDRVRSDLLSMSPETRLLYVTPEQVATEGFQFILKELHRIGKLARFAIDEAHCVSEWAPDFRPDYLMLGRVRDMFPDVPVVALTATASTKVFHDILVQLRLHQPVAIFKLETSRFRANLYYDVEFKEMLKEPFKNLKGFALKALGADWESEDCSMRGSGIIYCRKRNECEEVSQELTSLGLLTKPYHGLMEPSVRKETQAEWAEGRLPVIAATLSFGMGVDKAMVRFVAHWSVPQSVAAYYRESGRAGRDGRPSYCRIYYSHRDMNAITFLIKQDGMRARDKKGNLVGEMVAKMDDRLVEFQKMVNFCKGKTCRHAFLCREFGNDLNNCGKNCDACAHSKSLEARLFAFRMALQTGNFEKTSWNNDFDGDSEGDSNRASAATDSQPKKESIPKNCSVLEPKCSATYGSPERGAKKTKVENKPEKLNTLLKYFKPKNREEASVKDTELGGVADNNGKARLAALGLSSDDLSSSQDSVLSCGGKTGSPEATNMKRPAAMSSESGESGSGSLA